MTYSDCNEEMFTNKLVLKVNEVILNRAKVFKDIERYGIDADCFPKFLLNHIDHKLDNWFIEVPFSDNEELDIIINRVKKYIYKYETSLISHRLNKKVVCFMVYDWRILDLLDNKEKFIFIQKTDHNYSFVLIKNACLVSKNKLNKIKGD